MRISDWSSDVCSSDLEGSSATDSEDPHQYNKAVDCHHHSLQREPLHERLLRPLPQPKFQFHRLQRLHWSKSHPATAPDRRLHLFQRSPPNRKNVVAGKSVQVQGEHGGTRLIKKKKKK